MKHITHENLSWSETSTPGILKAEVERNSEGGGLAFWSVPKGSGFKHHGHKGYEYIYMVSGCMDFSGSRMEVGDFLLTSSGEEHSAIALDDSVILVINERKNS